MVLTAEDIEAGTRKKFQTEPTLPIYLKVSRFRQKKKKKKKFTLMYENVTLICEIHVYKNRLISLVSIWTGKDGGLSIMRSTQLKSCQVN